MYPAPFALERFFARHEFSARYLLSASDCQGPSMAELVAGAGADPRRRWEELTLGYTESQGLPELRTAIAGMYEGVDPAQVLVAAPEEAIFLAMHALLSPGDHVVCTFPGYQSLYELARSIGCEVDLWRPEETAAPTGEAARGPGAGVRGPAGPGWCFDPAALEALLRPDTRLVVWNFPHNPTGALPAAVDFRRMVKAVARAGAWLFSDEMYRLLEPAPGLRLPAAVDLYERAISLAGMSKAFGLAGLRIGWVATTDSAAVERMKALKDYTTICSSAPSEVLALMGLEAADAILAANRARIERNRQVAAAFCARHADRFSWIPPQAGTVCFPRLLTGGGGCSGGGGGGADGGEGGGAAAFCAEVLERTGALLLPSTVYGYGDSHVRLGLGREDFAAGLTAVDTYLEGDPRGA
jgi:aspartate/methionine/tyrosine aminotransferase